MTDDESALVQRLSDLIDQVREVVAERDQLRTWVKELQELTIDQQVEIGQLKRRLGEL